MPAIRFFYEDVKFRLLNPRSTKSWIKKMLHAEKGELGELNYVFCSDTFLLTLNFQYLNHKTYTDIITFDTSENDGLIQGDIYISVDRVKENALKFKTDFVQELHRVMVHGVLHLLGYADKSRQGKNAMRKKEDAYLSLKIF